VCNYLKVKDVSLVYGKGVETIYALKNVSSEFSPGEISLVRGHSGSGKTSLLSILGCMTSPTSGNLWVMNEDVTALEEEEKSKIRLRNIGYVFQAFRLFRALSALENIILSLDVEGYDKKNSTELALQALRNVGLEKKSYLKPSALSGGEKQRVAIARALVKQSDIILADEPTASLDTESASEISQLLFDLANKGNKVMIIASHDERLLPLANRIVTLRNGEIVETSKVK